MRYAICYVSTAVESINTEEIQKLLKKAEENNNKNGLKGMLLYSEGNFLEVIEGEKSYVLELFNDIKNDPRHTNIIQILGKDIDHGAYDGFESDIVTDKNKYDPTIIKDYMYHLEGMDPGTQEVVRRILEVFIETSK